LYTEDRENFRKPPDLSEQLPKTKLILESKELVPTSKIEEEE
jgi:hypothetical protein